MSLRLVTNDNKNINVSLEQILQFKFITSMLNIEDIDNNTYELEEDYEIPLDIPYNTLEKILEYSNYELNNKETHIHDKSVFYNNYFTCSDELLFSVMNSADYLNYDALLDKSCEKLADDILKCDSVDEVKKKFKITREFTPEEENEILEYAKI
tara:strand:+ start:130 stop:591 length:462 start_codon:yes stop_codon:yes gene_type:complete